MRLASIHGQNIGIVEDEIWLFLFERKEGEGSKRAEEFTASRFL